MAGRPKNPHTPACSTEATRRALGLASQPWVSVFPASSFQGAASPSPGPHVRPEELGSWQKLGPHGWRQDEPPLPWTQALHQKQDQAGSRSFQGRPGGQAGLGGRRGRGRRAVVKSSQLGGEGRGFLSLGVPLIMGVPGKAEKEGAGSPGTLWVCLAVFRAVVNPLPGPSKQPRFVKVGAVLHLAEKTFPDPESVHAGRLHKGHM